MKNTKKLLIAALILILTLVLAACGGGDSEDTGETTDTSTGEGTEEVAKDSDEQLVFGFTCMTMNNPFFQVLEENVREVVEANGDKLITMDPQLDVSLQINQVEDMISQGIDAIFLNPVDWEGIRPALVMLEEAGIPIINFDTEVKDFEYVTAYVGSDNYNAGFVAGEDMKERLPEGGKIAVLDTPTMNSINDRIEGFFDAIEGHPFEVVSQQNGEHTLELALEITEDVLIANPDIVAIMAGNDPMALGALAAAKAANNQDVIIYGVDGSPEAKAEIAEGSQLVGTGAQSPIQIGQISAEVAYKIMNGEEYDEITPVETFLITEENVDEYGVDGWQ